MKVASRFVMRKDYYAGALMVVIGAAATYASGAYHIGSLANMGAGFFPCAVGCLLMLVGVAIALAARDGEGTSVAAGHGYRRGMVDLRGCACIIAGILAFLFVGRYGGLLPATFAIVLLSALGDRNNKLREALLLAVSMCVIASVVFWWALQLQMPLFGWGG